MNSSQPAKTDDHSASQRSMDRAAPTEPVADGKLGALTVIVSPSARRRLAEATRNSFWTPDSVVEQLLMDHLHDAYPVVTYRNVELAPSGTFRAFDRRSHRPALVFLTSLGRYQISVRPENLDFQKLQQTFRQRGAAHPDSEAVEMSLFKLQAYLEDGLEERKIIYPDDFLVQQMVERAAVEAGPLSIMNDQA
jgi:hypothetical protein